MVEVYLNYNKVSWLNGFASFGLKILRNSQVRENHFEIGVVSACELQLRSFTWLKNGKINKDHQILHKSIPLPQVQAAVILSALC